MSYILDALNKSERERTGAKTPGLDTVHQRAEQVDSDSPQRWPLIFGHDIDSKLCCTSHLVFHATESRGDLDQCSRHHTIRLFQRITQDTVTGSQAFEQPQRNASRQPPNTLKRNQ